MCNAKDCEQYHPDNICCTCQNLEWYKLKQTITEIKKIAENGCYDDCGMPLDDLSIILQIINECEGNDDMENN